MQECQSENNKRKMQKEHRLLFNCPRRNGQYNRQRRNDQCRRDKRRQCNASSTGWELATDNPVLTLKVSVEANYEDEDGDADERGAERFADTAKAGGGRGDINRGRGKLRMEDIGVSWRSNIETVRICRSSRGIETEELGDGDTNGGEGERCAHPSQKCSLYKIRLDLISRLQDPSAIPKAR